MVSFVFSPLDGVSSVDEGLRTRGVSVLKDGVIPPSCDILSLI